MIIDEIMVVQKQDMQKHVRIPEITSARIRGKMSSHIKLFDK